MADDVYLKGGQVIKNCQVKDTVNNRVRIITTQREVSFSIYSISRIVVSQFVPNVETEISGATNINAPENLAPSSTINYDYPNAMLLPVSAVAFGLAWDYFAQVSDIQNAIDANNNLASQTKIQIDNSNLQNQKTRKTILGVTFLAAGVINTVFALKRVEVTATNNSIGLAYKF